MSTSPETSDTNSQNLEKQFLVLAQAGADIEFSVEGRPERAIVVKGDILAVKEDVQGKYRDIFHIPLAGDIFTAKIFRQRKGEMVIIQCHLPRITLTPGMTDLGLLRNILKNGLSA